MIKCTPINVMQLIGLSMTSFHHQATYPMILQHTKFEAEGEKILPPPPLPPHTHTLALSPRQKNPANDRVMIRVLTSTCLE